MPDKVIKLVKYEARTRCFYDSDGARWTEEFLMQMLSAEMRNSILDTGAFEIRVSEKVYGQVPEDQNAVAYVYRSGLLSCPACGGSYIRWKVPGPPFQGTCLTCEYVWETGCLLETAEA